MFSYYGSKSKIIHRYPMPKFERIMEPFAGSARYACLYYARDVWINDKYEVIYRIWKWIQSASWNDVKSLPDLDKGDDLRNIKSLSDDERLLMGFLVANGVCNPNNIVTGRGAGFGKGAKHESIPPVRSFKLNIKRMIGRIGHWKITCLDYDRLPNLKATWFIDPPYQVGGNRYKVNGVDYTHLLDWIKRRRGETITCENSQCTWLDRYDNLVTIQGSQQTFTTEVIRYGAVGDR